MRVFLDFDSTLVDLDSGWINWLKKEKGIKIKTQDIIHYNYVENTYGLDALDYWKLTGIYDDIKPIAGSQLFVKVLGKLYGKENIYIISNSVPHMIKEKNAYIQKYFNVYLNNCIHEKDKWKFTSDGFLVDDMPHNVILHTLNNKKPSILFNYRDRYGWAKLDNPVSMIYYCNNYAKCLETINTNRKYFND